MVFLIQFLSTPHRQKDDHNHLKNYSGVFSIIFESGIFTFLFLLILLVFQRQVDLIRSYRIFL